MACWLEFPKPLPLGAPQGKPKGPDINVQKPTYVFSPQFTTVPRPLTSHCRPVYVFHPMVTTFSKPLTGAI